MEVPTVHTNHTRKNSGLLQQLIVVAVVSLGMLNFGMVQGWMSPMEKILQSSLSPFGPLDPPEIGFVASLSFHITLVSALLSSYLSNRFGRKIALLLTGIPTLIGGILLAVANNKFELYVARSLMGFSAVSISSGPMYLSEIVHNSIRGTLVSIATFWIPFGILISYTVVKFLGYKAFDFLFIGVSALHSFLVFFLPETPHYLVSKSRLNAASKSLIWLRGGNTELADAELKIIENGQNTEQVNFFQCFKTKEARHALLIGVVTFGIQTLSGIHIILSFAETIFSQSESPINPDTSAIFVVLAVLIASIISLVLIDKLGRKPLFFFSLIVGFISHLLLTILLFLLAKGRPVANTGFLSIACVTVFLFSYGIGMSSMPALILNEVASVEIKSYVSTIALYNSVGLAVGVLQIFPILTKSFGVYANFIIPTLIHLLGIFFAWFFIPETKGKSLSEIAHHLKGRTSLS